MPPSDISRTKPLIRLILNQIGRRLTEDLQAKAGRHRLLLMLDEFPALGRLDFFESALAFMAGYGIKAFLIAQSLTRSRRPTARTTRSSTTATSGSASRPTTSGPPSACRDALGTATEMRAMKNYAGHRLSPWLGHLMVSRSGDRAAAADAGRGHAAPARPTRSSWCRASIRSGRRRRATTRMDVSRSASCRRPCRRGRKRDAPTIGVRARCRRARGARAAAGDDADDEDPKNADRRKQPELSQGTVEKQGADRE